MKQLGGVLRKDSTPGMPLALAIASSMTVVQGVRCARRSSNFVITTTVTAVET